MNISNKTLEKTLMLGKIEGRRTRGWQRMRCLNSITNSMNMNLGKLQEMVRDREAWHAAVHGVTKNHTWLNDWTTRIAISNKTWSFENTSMWSRARFKGNRGRKKVKRDWREKEGMIQVMFFFPDSFYLIKKPSSSYASINGEFQNISYVLEIPFQALLPGNST